MVTFGKKILILIIFILNTGMSCEENPASIPQSPPPVLVTETGFDLEGIAIEPGGKTVLATEGFSGKIWRFTLGTGEKTVVFDDPYTSFRTSGVVVEPSGKTALVTRHGSMTVEGKITDVGELIRIDTITGTYKVIASGFRFGFMPLGIAPEDGGETALVAEMDQLTRVNLTDGTKTPIATFEVAASEDEREVSLVDVAIESPGETAIVSQKWKGLWRVNLRTGTTHRIANLYIYGGLAYEPSKSRAIVSHYAIGFFGGDRSSLLQVDLVTGNVSTIAGASVMGDIVIEEGGQTALFSASAGYEKWGIYRVQLP